MRVKPNIKSTATTPTAINDVRPGGVGDVVLTVVVVGGCDVVDDVIDVVGG